MLPRLEEVLKSFKQVWKNDLAFLLSDETLSNLYSQVSYEEVGPSVPQELVEEHFPKLKVTRKINEFFVKVLSRFQRKRGIWGIIPLHDRPKKFTKIFRKIEKILLFLLSNKCLVSLLRGNTLKSSRVEEFWCQTCEKALKVDLTELKKSLKIRKCILPSPAVVPHFYVVFNLSRHPVISLIGCVNIFYFGQFLLKTASARKIRHFVLLLLGYTTTEPSNIRP